MNVNNNEVKGLSGRLFLLCLSTVIFLPACYIKAQPEPLKFSRIAIKDERVNSVILSIRRDSKGYMWVGTATGLLRFDAYKYKEFINRTSDSLSISDNRAFDICEDKNKNIWVATFSGLNKYERTKSVFSRYYLIKNPSHWADNFFLHVMSDKKGRVWVKKVFGGLYLFHPEKGGFEKIVIDKDDPEDPLRGEVTDCIMDKDENFWFCINDQNKSSMLGCYNYDTKQVIYYMPDSGNTTGLSNRFIRKIMEDSKGNIWLGLENGLSKLDVKTGKFRHFLPDDRDSTSLLPGIITLIEEDDFGMIWLGTGGNGLSILDPITGKFTRYKSDLKDKTTLRSNTITALYYDHAGTMWIGTDKGLNTYTFNYKKFHNYLFASKDGEAINPWIINDVRKNKDNSLCYCTDNGFFRYDKRNNPELILNVRCTNSVIDRWGNFWITNNAEPGICYRYNPVNKEITRYYGNPDNRDSLRSNDIWSVHVDRDTLWMGTGGGGLNAMVMETGKVVLHYVHNPSDTNSISADDVGTIFKDKNFVWIGPYKAGLNRIDITTGNVMRFHPDPKDPGSLSHHTVSSIYKDRKNRLWVGTTDGLNLLQENGRTFRKFGEKEGLASAIINIKSLCEDADGNIWFSTPLGISKINPKTFAIQNYDHRDGFQINPSPESRMESDGEILLYGLNGITIFRPEEIRDNPIPPPVSITDFQIFNKSIVPGENSPLKKEINETNEIVLSHKETFLTFEFAAHNYVLTDKNQYAYRLEGFEENWNYVGARRFAYYTKIPPGEYTFTVKASNNDGIWNETGTSVKLIITPPYWQTWWFRTMVVLSLVGLSIGWYRYRFNRIKQQKEQLEKQVQERTSELTRQGKMLQELYTEVKDSIRAAQVIQHSILPPEKLVKEYLPEWFVLNKPKDVVSGDFYWFDTKDGKIIVAVADCTGHGVSGAFMSINGYHLLNQVVHSTPLIASKILDRINEEIIEDIQHGLHENGMDMALCIIDINEMRLQYAGAASPLYMVRNGDLISIKADPFSIGQTSKHTIRKYTNHEVAVQKRDMIYMFSDGYADQMGGTKHEKFSYKNFRELLVKISTADADKQLELLDRQFVQWRAGHEQLDDVLITGFKIPG